jgi:hypothetical protein
MTAHLNPQIGELGFEFVDFLLHGDDVHRLRRLEGVPIARNVEVEVVYRAG